MDTTEINRLLLLNKETVANLNNRNINGVGGNVLSEACITYSFSWGDRCQISKTITAEQHHCDQKYTKKACKAGAFNG